MRNTEKRRARNRDWQRSERGRAWKAAYRVARRSDLATRPKCAACSAPIPYPATGRRTCSEKCRKSIAHKPVAKSDEAREFETFKCGIGCSACGYNRCGGALDFHHTGTDKERRVTKRNWKSKLGRREMEKCVLVCANCHREEHHGGRVPEIAHGEYLQ